MSDTLDPEVSTTGETAASAVATPAAPNNFVSMQEQLFHFKTETLKNEKGEKVGEGKKHPSVKMYLPVPKAERLAEFLLAEGEDFKKERELVLNVVADLVYRMARVQINDYREKNVDSIVTPAIINYDRLDWTFIGNMPKAERGAYVPDEADVKAFLDSYLEIMPTATNKTKEKIENHIVCFQSGFKKQRAQKEILEMFASALAVYVSTAGEELVEEHGDVIEYFQNRLARMLKTEEKITMDDL